MSVFLALREVTVTDREGQTASWSGTEAGCNKPQNTRPLALFPAKESNELLSEYIPLVEAEINLIKKDGVHVQLNKKDVKAVCRSADLTMADGKMVTSLMRLGGAYCTMCTGSQEQCHHLEVVAQGFFINRSIETITELAIFLADKDTSDVVRARGDYNKRQGVCGMPITESDNRASGPSTQPQEVVDGHQQCEVHKRGED